MGCTVFFPLDKGRFFQGKDTIGAIPSAVFLLVIRGQKKRVMYSSGFQVPGLWNPCPISLTCLYFYQAIDAPTHINSILSSMTHKQGCVCFGGVFSPKLLD